MTGRRRPPRQGSGPPAAPKGFEGAPVLSAEEVERRVEVRGGGTPPPPPVQRPVRRAPPPRRRERTVARDSLLLLGLVIVGLVAVSFLLPNGPLSAAATNPPGTEAAVGSTASPTTAPSATSGPTPTPIVIVDPSVAFSPPPTEAPTAAPPTAVPTAAPPTPTLKPGQTPHPTPKPTPVVTPKPTSANTATVIVVMHVINNSGGTAGAAAWHMLITGEASASAVPNGFVGSEAGRAVTVPAGEGYRVVDDSSVPGYAGRLASADCIRPTGGGLPAGTTVTCTITRNDRPHVTVTTHVINDDAGSASASDWTVTVAGQNVSKPSFSGSESGVVVVVGFDVTYTITESGPSGYDETSSGDCAGVLGVDAPPTSCTFTLDDVAPPPTLPQTVLSFTILPFVLPRRWRPTRRR